MTYRLEARDGGWGVISNGRLIYWTDQRREAEGFLDRLIRPDDPARGARRPSGASLLGDPEAPRLQ